MTVELHQWGDNLANRDFRNKTNENWKRLESSYGILEKDSVNVQVDINHIKKQSEEAAKLSKNVQEQVNTLVIDGDSSPEAAQARTDVNGVTHSTLKDRIDSDSNKVNHLMYMLTHKLDFKGAAVTTFANTDYNYVFGRLKEINCNAQVVQMCNVSSYTSDTVTIQPDAELTKAILSATEKGVPIQLLKPHVGVNGSDGSNKTAIKPTNVSNWFNSYKPIIMHYAEIAHNNNIPILSVGNELSSLTGSENIQHWKDIIYSIRQLYPELILTYACTFNELVRMTNDKKTGKDAIMNYVDLIGGNIYPQMTTKDFDGVGNITVEELIEGIYLNHDNVMYVNAITDACRLFSKDILITETGIMPKIDSLKNFIATGAYNTRTQSLYYQSVLSVLGSMHQVKGIFIWHIREPFDFFDGEGEVVIKEMFGEVL
ncbi:glycoside hydrolase family 113 [Bacillus cereus]|uniref:glycoside hydrolase family 113 n=1 Tax=Bacillus cereus TaxID=1396 RepID=UPI000BF407ED|nr:hypothetical protein [Bacillus cereus]PFB24124.1 hypothetical protein CN388_25470 [Bacillus cereus]